MRRSSPFKVAAEAAGLPALVCISKNDLAAQTAGLEATLAEYRRIGYSVQRVSVVTGGGADLCPLSMDVSAINSVSVEKRAALQRLRDLYLAGEFHKDMLIDKKTELEGTIADLEKERLGLLASMRTQSVSAEQEQTLIASAQKVEGLDHANSSFHLRHDFIEASRAG